MRSALPKHLHPILGRRMVDWVLEAARPLDPSPLVVVASPDTASSFDGVEVAVQERPLGTGDAVRSAREALAGADEVLVLSGDTPLLTTELLDGLLATHRERAPARPCSRSSRTTSATYGRIVRDATGGSSPSSRRSTPRRSSSLSPRPTPRSTSSAPTGSGPRWTRSRPRTPRASSTSPTRSGCSSTAGETVAVHVAAGPAEAEGVNTRAELAAAAAASATGSTSRTCSRASRSSTRRDLDRPDGRARAGRRRASVHRPAGRDAVAARRRVGPHVVAVDARSERGRSSGRSVTFGPAPCSSRSAKAGTFVEIKNTVIGEGTKVPHLSYIGRRRHRSGHERRRGGDHRELPAPPRAAQVRTRIGEQRQVAG